MAPTTGAEDPARRSGTDATTTAVPAHETPTGAPGRAHDGRSPHAFKPRLRGWIHAGMAPVAAIAGIALVVLSPTSAARWSTAVFAVATTVLFTASAVYHRGTWSPATTAALRRLDHSNILLVIAGTYTPLAVLLLPTTTAAWLLAVIWTGALAGIAARVFWLSAPRWFYVPLYVILGLISVGYLPQFSAGGNGGIVWLVAAGGVAYILGAVVYGIKRPNPHPEWFGFHEVFHVLTVVGYLCHYVAVSIAAYTAT